MTSPETSRLVAVLGPTNTGKTHLAIERLCAHSSGMMGFPLRLLAREVYDRVVAIKGVNRVALITGEEKIIPPEAQWFLCTAESMPTERDFAFVALDEAQLAQDRERGHIFTNHLLHSRGREETMILGSEALRPMIRRLLPEAEIITRPRFSQLTFAGSAKLSQIPRRSAIVAFSAEDVYAIAEMLRRKSGGAAIVMGSLSPQTRNAQVAMYQAGEVDYLVATDAIGMGLNLDIHHVAFASLNKFDGLRRRRLTTAEIGQIAGRAGRHHRDGSFFLLGGMGGAEAMSPQEIEALENHNFRPLEWLYWRSSDLEFSSLEALFRSLEQKPRWPELALIPESVDEAVMRRLVELPGIAATLMSPDTIARLWEAASIPDFRKVGPEHQSRFVASLWQELSAGNGTISRGRIAREIAQLDNVQGDIPTLAARVAAARTWSYVAHKPHWTDGADDMIGRAKALEQRLSDAMHRRLTERFVDQRTSLLLRGLGSGADALPVRINANGAVDVGNQRLGDVRGFQFSVISDSSPQDRKIMVQAAMRYLGGYMVQLADQLAKAADAEIQLVRGPEGRPEIHWQGNRIGTLVKGSGWLQPAIRLDPAIKELSAEIQNIVEQRLVSWSQAVRSRHLEGLVRLETLAQAPDTPPHLRALYTQLIDEGGIAMRSRLEPAIRLLDKDMRSEARRAGLTFGALDIFHHQLMKPGAVLWRAALFSAWEDDLMLALPGDNAVHLRDVTFAKPFHATRLGFRQIGEEYVRVDMAERLVRQAHEARAVAEKFPLDPALATSLGLSQGAHANLLHQAGFVEVATEPLQEKPLEDGIRAETIGDGGDIGDSVIAVEQPIASPAAVLWQWRGMAKRNPRPEKSSRRAAGNDPARKVTNKRPSRNAAPPKPRKAEIAGETKFSGAFAALAVLTSGGKPE